MTTEERNVRSLGGILITIKSLITLTVEICNLIVMTFILIIEVIFFLLGSDLISAAALTIDCEASCVWSNHTIRHQMSQDPTHATLVLTRVSADCVDMFS